MCEAAGIKGGGSRFSVTTGSGVDTKGIGALDWKTISRAINGTLMIQYVQLCQRQWVDIM